MKINGFLLAYTALSVQRLGGECRGQDSNLRSFTQRILSPPPLTAREPRLAVEARTNCF
jgi:hypothetical protein